MKSFLIQDRKEFMNRLLGSELFDAFEVVSAQLTTFCTFTVDGTYIPGYLSEEEPDPASSAPEASAAPFALWKTLRPHLFDLIRGKSKPGSIRIVLRLSQKNTERMLRSGGSPLHSSDVSGFFLNISYQHREQTEQITCITGTSLKTFTLDKTAEHVWDEMAGRFFRKAGIPFLEE